MRGSLNGQSYKWLSSVKAQVAWLSLVNTQEKIQGDQGP